MTVGKFFGYLFLLLILALIALIGWIFLGKYVTNYFFTYRLTVEVEVDGATKTGSTLYRVRAFKSWNQVSTRPKTLAAGTASEGVAALIDLGRYGTLVAAQDYNSPHYWKYRKERGLPELDYHLDMLRPVAPSELLYAAYVPGKDYLTWPEPHRALAGVTHRVQLKRFPPFIWIPPSGNFREARQLMPDQFAEVIGPGVKLKAAWIEPVRWVFWVPTKYDKMPKWLEENIAWMKEPNQDIVERSPPHEFRLFPRMIIGNYW